MSDWDDFDHRLWESTLRHAGEVGVLKIARRDARWLCEHAGLLGWGLDEAVFSSMRGGAPLHIATPTGWVPIEWVSEP